MLRLLPLHSTFPAVLYKSEVERTGKAHIGQEKMAGPNMYYDLLQALKGELVTALSF